MSRTADGSAQVVHPYHKGFPATAVGRSVAALRGLDLAGASPVGRFTSPVLLLREDRLDGNLAAMRRFCERAGMSLAPHVKTTMSPQLFGRQQAAGAWAATVATPVQLRTVRHWGVRRLLLANQLVDPDATAWLGAELDRDPEFTAYCYVDSGAGLDALTRVLVGRGQRRPVPVLVELGIPGGRGGVREVAAAVALAEQVAGRPQLRLAGVGGFEGVIDARTDPAGPGAVEDYLGRLREVTDRIHAGPGGSGELIVTVGGSAYPELVRDAFPPEWRAGRSIRVVLRSGCYLTHDHGAYQGFRALAADRDDPLVLRPALELWARVLSRPEPGLALVDLGRRDTGTDAGLPVPHWWLPGDRPEIRPAPAVDLVALNDQHGYLRVASPDRSLPLAVGDLVGFGISHPCTTLDKWRLIPVVDADRRLTGAVDTWF